MKIFILITIYYLGIIAATYVPFQATSFQTLARKSGTSPIAIDISDNDQKDFLVVGYFKLATTTNKSSIIRLSIEEESINLLHLYALLSSSLVYARAISNSQLNYSYIINLSSVSSPINSWKIYGIGYKSTSNTLFLVHDYILGTQMTLQMITYNLSYPLTIIPAKFTLCIGCTILGSVYSEMSGTYSSIKLLTGFTIQGTNTLFYNLNGMSNEQLKLSYLSNSSIKTLVETQFSTSDLTCSPNYGFFEGVCVLLSNCSSLPQLESDEQGSLSNSMFYDPSSSSCKVCGNNCSQCSSMTYCTKCNDGFQLDSSTNTCSKCSTNYFYIPSTQTCSASCPSGLYEDLANQLCVESFNPYSHMIGPFFNTRQFSQSSGFQIIVTSTSQIALDCFELCMTSVNFISPRMFYGGASLLSIHSIKKIISNIPTNTYESIISFNAMFTGADIAITLSINSVSIPSTSQQTILSDVGICADSGQSYQIVSFTFSLFDNQSSYNIQISSPVNGWGIRDFQIKVKKCHPSCDYCYGPKQSQCWTCNKKVRKQSSQCFCEFGYYVKPNPSCYQTDCYTCFLCPPECATCSDFTGKCISCAAGYILKGQSCILSSNCSGNFSQKGQLCTLDEQVIIQHFFNNKIEQYFDYWIYSQNDESLKFYDCLGELWIAFIYKWYVQLKQMFTNYYTYNHSFKFTFAMTNKDSIDTNDYIEIFDTSTSAILLGRFYQFAERNSINGFSSGCGGPVFWEKKTTHSVIYPKSVTSSSSLNFQLMARAMCDANFLDEGFLMNNFQISFLFCHPSCLECQSNSPYNCITCIDNAEILGFSPSCPCSLQYYLSISSENFRGTCKPCNSVCKTCQGESYLDCLTCNDGYEMQLGECVSICLIGTYFHAQKGICFQCSPCCKECRGPLADDCFSCQTSSQMTFSQGKCFFQADGSQCTSCSHFSNGNCGGLGTAANVSLCHSLEWFNVDSSSCAQCKGYYEVCGGYAFQRICTNLGYLFDFEQQYCFPCSLANQQTCGTEKISEGCIKNGWIFYQSSTCVKCTSNFQHPACQTCNSSCQTCSGPAEFSCLTCMINLYYFQGYCLSACTNGYKANLVTKFCDQCLFLASPGCQTCFPTCKICSPLGISFHANTCTSCYTSRQLENGMCNCKDAEDTRVTFYECSYKNQAVVDILLSNNSPTMIIEFGKILQELTHYKGQNSNEVCVALFDQASLDLLGVDSNCTILGSQIIVTLGSGAEVFEGDIIILFDYVLMFKSETIYINTFFNYVVVQQKPINLQIGFSYNKMADTCKDFKVYLKYLSGDSSRGFKTLIWSLLNANSANSEDVALLTILANASMNKLTTLIVPKGSITIGVVKTIQLDLVMRNTYTTSKIFIFQFSRKSISLVVTKSFLTPLYRFNQVDLSLEWELKYCDPNEIPTFFSERVNLRITSAEIPSLSITENSFPSKNYIDSIPPYSLNALSTYNFLVGMALDIHIEAEDNLELYITPSPLVVLIKGGSKQIDYRESKTFQSYLRDRDLQDPAIDQGIAPKWNCVDPITELQCRSITGTLVNFNSGPTATIDAGTFLPYSFAVIYLIGTKDTRTTSTQCFVAFSEFDLPNLDISMQMIDPQQQTINLNEEVYVSLEYGANVNTEILSYSGTVVYKLNSVGVILFDYTTFRFKLWNIFSDFKRQSPYFSLRLSVYNPNYFMPSSTILQFKLNFPPHSCKFKITPSDLTSSSLTTTFSLEMIDCIDEDIPIQYQFFYYTNQAELDEEIANPIIIRRKQIADISIESSISTILPSGNLILLAQAIDRKQAISNSTKTVPVVTHSLTESQYSNVINSFLDSNNKTLSTYISQLSILSQDLSFMTSFTSSAITDQKKTIISTLQRSTLLLPKASQFQDMINKAISSLINSGISYSSTEQQNQLSDMYDSLTSSLPNSFTSLKKESRKQQLFDYFQSVNGMALKNNLTSTQEASDLQMNLIEKISDTLNEYSLPNENQIHFEGDSVSVSTQKITSKYLCAYYRCNNSDFQNNQDDGQTRRGRFLVDSSQPSIYGVSLNQYKDNPFYSDITFQNYTSYLKNSTNETLACYPFVLPSIKDTNNQAVSINKEISVEFKQQNNKTSGLTCFTKSPGSGWSKEGCNKVYSPQYKSFTCICQSSKPTTLVDDLESAIINKNLQTAFSTQGLSNISSWNNFYEFVAFWQILSETIVFLYLLRQGKILDDQQNKFFQVDNFSKVVPLNSNGKLIGNHNNNGDDNSSNNNNEKKALKNSKNQMGGNQKIEEDKLGEVNIDDSIIQNIQQNRFKKSDYYPKFLVMNSIENNEEVNSNSSPVPKLDFQKIEIKNSTVILQKSSNIETLSVIGQQEDAQLEGKRQNPEVFKFKEKDINQFSQVKWIKQILFFHNFFNIFFLYDPKQSRQLRFSIFYVRLVHSLAVSIVYDQQFSQPQMIAVSILNAIIVTIVLKLLEFLTNFKYFGKKLASVFLAAMLVFYYYLILSIVSGQDSSESNKSIVAFIIVFVNDLVIIATLTAVVMRFLAQQILKDQGKYKFSKQVIEFLKLQMILEIIKKI